MKSEKYQTFPRWYIRFQATMLLQLPRPEQIGENCANYWSNNGEKLKSVLANSLLAPDEKGNEGSAL